MAAADSVQQDAAGLHDQVDRWVGQQLAAKRRAPAAIPVNDPVLLDHVRKIGWGSHPDQSGDRGG